MKHFIIVVLVFWTRLLVSPCAVVADPSDALVVVSCHTPKGTAVGNGFAVGDGTTIITAAHLVSATQPPAGHAMKGLCTVISPFLGDAVDAEIKAVDTKNDLAILKVRWSGHPKLRVASAEEVPSSGPVQILTLRLEPTTREGPAHAIGSLVRTQAHVDHLAMFDGKPLSLALQVDEEVTKGWSGAPIVLTDTETVVGCLVATVATTKEGGARSKLTTAQALVKLDQLDAAILPRKASEGPATRPADAARSFFLFTELFEGGEKNVSLADELVKLRPNSSAAVGLRAIAEERAGHASRAEPLYQRALELHASAQSYVFYAQYLAKQDKRPQAEQLLEKAWTDGVSPSAIASVWVPLLRKRAEFQKAQSVLETALKDDPQNAYFWFWLGQTNQSQHKLKDATAAFSKAAELLPQMPLIRMAFAGALAESGEPEQAEKQYEAAIAAEPKNPLMQFAFAQFLAKRGPEKRERAIAAAEAALALPESRGLSKQTIQKFIDSARHTKSSSTTQSNVGSR